MVVMSRKARPSVEKTAIRLEFGRRVCDERMGNFWRAAVVSDGGLGLTVLSDLLMVEYLGTGCFHTNHIGDLHVLEQRLHGCDKRARDPVLVF